MFGLTEQELDRYKYLAQEFAITQVAPMIVHGSEILAPVVLQGDKYVTIPSFMGSLVTDIEIVVTVTAMHMAYEYAHLQSELEIPEIDVINHLHDKYETQVINQFIRYGVVFSTDVATQIVSAIIVELPYMYIAVVAETDFDEDSFLDSRLDAYEEYLFKNSIPVEEDGDDEDWEEEDDE